MAKKKGKIYMTSGKMGKKDSKVVKTTKSKKY